MKFLLILFFTQSFLTYSQSYTFENKYSVETIEFLTDSTYIKNYYSKETDCITPGYINGKYLIRNDSLIMTYIDFSYNNIEITSIKNKKNEENFIHLQTNFKDINNKPIGPIWGEINNSKICSDIDGHYNSKIDNKDFTLKLFSFFDNKTLVLNKKFQAGFDYTINAIVGEKFINSENYKIHSYNDENLILYSLSKRNKKLNYIKD